jgi:hypothetical protein
MIKTYPSRKTLFPVIGLLLVVPLLIAACTPSASPSTSPSAPASNTPAPSETPRPSATLAPSATLPPTSTVTPSPSSTSTITLTPTPAAAFEKFQIISVDNGVGGVNVIIRLPGVTVPYQVKIRGYQYNCELVPTAPDRLFCVGLAAPPFDIALDVIFSDPNTKQVVYTGSAIYASAALYTPTLSDLGKNSCADRGKGLSCETECRLLPDGSACIVSTCTDACGLYSSIQTCPDGMSKDFLSCPPDLFAQMKKRYGIP